jgi:hypothetical protein
VTEPVPPPGSGTLVVHLRRPFLRGDRVQTPLLLVDEHPLEARWGPNAFHVVPGPHRVWAAARFRSDFGAAAQLVEVPPGGVREVFWAGPALTWSNGRMGLTPPRRAGVVGFWLLMAAMTAAILSGVVGLLLAVAG